MPGVELEFDVALGEQGYLRHKVAAEALDKGAIRPISADARKLALVALGISAAIERLGLMEDFERLGRSRNVDFEIRHVEDLESLAWGLWYAGESQSTARVGESGARVSVETVEGSRATKSRMLKVLGYHFDDDEGVAAELRAIRQGSGYLDLASDLSRLANLYQQHKDALSGDTRHYSEGDEAGARRLAASIVAELSGETERVWVERTSRFAALLEASYSEVKAAASFIFRSRPGVLESFPSLVGAARRF